MKRQLFIINALLLIFWVGADVPLLADNNIQLYLQQAEEALNHQEYSVSIEHYRRVLAIRPFTKEAYNGLGKVYAALNRDDEALREFEKAIAIDPNFVDCLNNLAWLYIEREQYDTSARYLTEVLNRDPDNVTARLNQAFILLKQNRKRDARVQLVSIIDKYPDCGEAYYYLADLLREERGDIWSESHKKEWIDRARLDQRLLELESVIRRYYETAISKAREKTFPSIRYGTFLNELAEEHIAKGSMAVADNLKREALRQLSAVKNNTGNIDVLLMIAYLENTIASDSLTQATLTRIRQLNPTHTISLYNTALTYVSKSDGQPPDQKDIDNAIVELLKTIKIDPEDEIALYMLEEILVRHRSVDEPDRLALAREHIAQGEKYFNAKKMMLSLRHYRRAVRLTPQSPLARKEAATYYYKNQLFTHANFQVGKLLELDPYDRDAQDLREFLSRDAELLREKSGLVGELEPIEQPALPVLVLNFKTENPSLGHWNAGDIAAEMLRSRLRLMDGYKVIDITPPASLVSPDPVAADDFLKQVSYFSVDPRLQTSSLKLDAFIEELTLQQKARLVVWGTFEETGKSSSIVYHIMDITSKKKIENKLAAGQGEDRIDFILDNIIATLRQTLSPPGKIYKIRKNQALVNLGRVHNVKKGSILYIFRDMDKAIPHLDLRSNGEKSNRLRFLGYIKVTGAIEYSSIGEIIPWADSSEKIQLNDEVFLYGTLFPIDEDIRFRESQKDLFAGQTVQ